MEGRRQGSIKNQRACHRNSVSGVDVAAVDVLAGDVQDVLLGCRRELDADLIVMGAYGHSRIRQFLVGSITTAMLQRTDCPLLLLR